MAGPNNGPMFPNQPLDPTAVSTSNNTMLRTHLENNVQGQGQQSKLVQQLSGQQQQPQQQQQPGSSLLLSQLAKVPANDPNPNVINKVAGDLVAKVPNETLPNLTPGMQQQQQQQQQPRIKTEMSEIKTEIKTEPMDASESSSTSVKQEPSDVDVKPNIKKEIKTEVVKKSDLPPKGANKVTFTRDELKKALMPPLEKMYKCDPESHPFRVPVDPIGLGIPDYFDIIKKPMDLSTIKNNLDAGKYKEPWEFVDDVWLMFENAWVYNKKTSRVYKYCTKLSEVFESEIDPVMQSLGYCCGRKHTYSPQTLCCYGQQNTICTISRDAQYFVYENK